MSSNHTQKKKWIFLSQQCEIFIKSAYYIVLFQKIKQMSSISEIQAKQFWRATLYGLTRDWLYCIRFKRLKWMIQYSDYETLLLTEPRNSLGSNLLASLLCGLIGSWRQGTASVATDKSVYNSIISEMFRLVNIHLLAQITICFPARLQVQE